MHFLRFTAIPFFFLLLLLLFVSPVDGHEDGSEHEHTTRVIGLQVINITSPVRIPKPISDLTTVVHNETGKVYISGGCDSLNGNTYNTEVGVFICDSVSSKQYEFDIATQTFSEEYDMPRTRYRHAAVIANNQLFLVGGRDVQDNIVKEVDVFDLTAREWNSYNFTDSNYELSDLAGFPGPDGLAYFTGGYNSSYTAQSWTFAIDPEQTKFTGTLMTVPKTNLPSPRGDCQGAYVLDEGFDFAIVVGGFTHENDFCDVLNTTERYDFKTDTWSDVGDLIHGRADKALVALGHHAYAIGGERQLSGICNVDPEDEPEPGEKTVPVDDVEYFDGAYNNWTVVRDLPAYRFRFAAVGYQDIIYTFGGQLAYDESCMCFPNSDEVIMYKEEFSHVKDESGSSSSRKSVIGFGFTTTIMLATGWMSAHFL